MASNCTGSSGKAQARQPDVTDLGKLDPHVDISIVIVNWNTKDLLYGCLSSIFQNAGSARLQVIVVDNGSRDDSVDMVARHFPNVGLVPNERNLGFAVANNYGLRRAQGRYLLLLNSDTIVLPGAFDAMVRYMDAHSDVGALGPRLLSEDRSLQLSTRDFPRLDHDVVVLLEVKHWLVLGDLARRYAQRAFEADYLETHQVDWVQGSCLMLRREAIEQVGVLDENYFFDYEESDLCYRLRQRGWPTVFFAGAEIVHLGGRSRSRVKAVSLIWHYKSMLRYYRLHATRRRYLAVRIGVAIGAAGHVLWRLLWPWSFTSARPFLSAYAHVCANALTD